MAANLEVHGAGVRRGRAGQPNTFTITPIHPSSTALASITIAFDGPSEPSMQLSYTTDKVTVQYTPSAPGKYMLSVTKSGQDINGSPFTCLIEPESEARLDLVKVTGPGLSKARPGVGNVVEVDVGEAFILGPLTAYMSGKAFPIRKYGKPTIFIDNPHPTLHTVKFIPHFSGTFKLYLEFDKLKLPGSPYQITVADPDVPVIENWPTRHRPKKMLFTAPEPQRLVFTGRPV